MLTKIRSIANIGLETVPVDVEVDVASAGFPGFTIVGLPSKAVEEARERVKTAIINSGLDFPPRKITVNLAPADLPKDGAAYDLPIALGVLLASGQLGPLAPSKAEGFFYGELSLDGTLRPTKGILLLALFASKTKYSSIFVPAESSKEASVVGNIKVFGVKTLSDLVRHLSGAQAITPLSFSKVKTGKYLFTEYDLAEVAGQEQAKRALIIAASGGHNLLMYGPPGTGKTMLSRALPGILPPLTTEESLEVTRIYSVSGLLPVGQPLITKRPFRSPHHGISTAGMIGGGSNPLPGEVSLSHLGVLFLDEMPEFQRSIIESLRQPMEDGNVEIVRVAGHVKYPASFTLVAAINPCPCGYLGHPKRNCTCSPKQIAKYKHKISGPILDRIDLFVQVGVVETEKLAITTDSQKQRLSSKEARKQVLRAREMQKKRFRGEKSPSTSFRTRHIYTNSQMKNSDVKKHCNLTNKMVNKRDIQKKIRT